MSTIILVLHSGDSVESDISRLVSLMSDLSDDPDFDVEDQCDFSEAFASDLPTCPTIEAPVFMRFSCAAKILADAAAGKTEFHYAEFAD